MVKVLVGSQNPVKLEAAKEAFSKYFSEVEVVGIVVGSKVSGQPINEETFEGARNRALELRRINREKGLEGKFFVGIEGGILKLFSRWFALSVMCIIDDKGRTGYGASPFFEMPKSVTKNLLNGIELGDVMDNLAGERNIKQRQGAAGYFTRGVVDREGIYIDGLIAALIPFLNEQLYFKE